MLLKSGKSKQPFLMNVLSLGFADLLIYFTSIVYHTLRFINGINATVGLVYIYAVTVSTLSSQLHLVSIAIQRLIAVKYPLQCQRYLTQRRCVMALAFIWLMSLSLPAYWRHSPTQMTYITSIICATILLLSYAYISFSVLRKKNIGTARNNSGQSVLCFSLAITLAFLVCTFPFVIISAMNKGRTTEYFGTVCLFWLNPLLDPIVYFLFNKLKSSKTRCLCLKRNRIGIVNTVMVEVLN